MEISKSKNYLLSIAFLSLTLLAAVFISPTKVNAACYNSTQDNVPNGTVDGDIDHYDLECFTEIPDNWLQSASNLRLLFIDRSVGGNINDGLNCLGSGATYASAPNSCKSGMTESTYISHTKFNRSNWDFAHYGDGGWDGNVSNFILNQGLRSADGNSWTPNYSSYDVFNFQFSYLAVAPGSNIVGSSGYFRPYPGDTNRIRDVHDMEAFESTWSNKTFVQATTSLARIIGGQTSNDFNNLMRDYSESNNYILIDFADIGSYDPNGNQCTDSSGFPILCEDYTTEVNGGHLSYGLGKQRVAKAMWIMMAGVAGWQPGNSSTPPPTTPPTATPLATATPTALPTNTPTATPGVPGDATGDGVVDGLDYVVWLNNYGELVSGASNGDFDNSSSVDGIDYVIWLNNYGN